MKRLNPQTNQPFKRGDIREDGRLFYCYKTTKIKQDGFFVENWLTLEAMQKHVKTMKHGQKEWYKRNSEHVKQKARKHELANPESTRAKKAKWKSNNRSIENYHSAKRRTAKLNRTPKWLSEDDLNTIQAFYSIAAMLTRENGVAHHVDHIIPLQGKNVSGLHVPANLQVIPALENVKKSNKHNI